MADNFLVQLLSGKRVALVGPSESIRASGFGLRIDRYDVVVRMNHQWPMDEALVPDIGRRMDVLYHCCNPDFPIERMFNDEFRKTKLVCFERGVQTEQLLAHCRTLEIPTLDTTGIYNELRQTLSTFPNTGLVAVTHLLRYPITELSLFGMTFFRERYYDGYPGCGAEPQNWVSGALPERIWAHDLPAQYDYFVKLHQSDSRIRIDERARLMFDRSVIEDARYRSSEGSDQPASFDEDRISSARV